jgi:hypothetical protein
MRLNRNPILLSSSLTNLRFFNCTELPFSWILVSAAALAECVQILCRAAHALGKSKDYAVSTLKKVSVFLHQSVLSKSSSGGTRFPGSCCIGLEVVGAFCGVVVPTLGDAWLPMAEPETAALGLFTGLEVFDVLFDVVPPKDGAAWLPKLKSNLSGGAAWLVGGGGGGGGSDENVGGSWAIGEGGWRTS